MTRPDAPRIPDFSQSLPMTLLQARENVARFFRPMLRDHALTEQQWRVLRSLADHGALEISTLAGHCFILLPSLSRILQNLEARGLVTRRPVHRDQRRSEIMLSPKGRALFRATTTQVEAAYAEIARRFGTERMAELKSLLDLLIRETENP
jgi:homoprotocatechuate degradation regulator HpaR